MKKKVTALRIVSVTLLIATAAVIFFFSAQTSTKSSNTSGGITRIICEVFYPSFNEKYGFEQKMIIKQLHNPVRKAAHITVYSFLSLFAFLSLISYKNIPFALRNTLSVGFCLIFSASDEIHQLFVSGRGGMLSDVIIDSVGIFAAAAILTIIFTKTRLKRIAFSEA